ncbi:MAG TPA: C2 family cysteine protease, partial [Nocardioidaceae bacterium]|nr:C2 family cysteine protease [Nocardioidaceae bacterium]
MLRDDTRGGGGSAGPFEHYPASPSAVSGQADELLATAVRIGRVGGQAYAREQRAIAATDGALAALFDGRLAELRDQTVELKSAAVVASGALTIWACAIADYNSRVDQLNAEYPLVREDRFAVAVVQARLSALQEALDETAGRVGQILDRGPSESAVLRLFQHGTLPLSVTSLMSEYDFSGIDIGELVRRLQRHGELPYDLDPHDVGAAVRLLERLTEPDHLTWSWNRTTLTMAWEQLAELDPRAVDLVVLGLSDDQLTLLDRLMSTTSIGERLPGVESGLDRFDLADFHTLFLANASTETLRRLQRCWRSINPTIKNVDAVEQGAIDRPRWRKPDTGGLFDGPPTADDIDQGAVGDCWMQAKLAALAQDDSDWVNEHVRRNPNGTITVTFYDDDGDPHEVTVTSELPVDDYGDRVYSGDDDGAPWADYYEKAFALISDNHHDAEAGYGGIEYGRASLEAMLMTGHDAG